MKFLVLIITLSFSFSTMAMNSKCPKSMNVKFSLKQILKANLQIKDANAAICSYEGVDENNKKVSAQISISSNRFKRSTGTLYVNFLDKNLLIVSNVTLSPTVSFDVDVLKGDVREIPSRIYNTNTGIFVGKTKVQSIY